MTVVLARLRQVASWVWAGLAVVGAVVGAWAAYALLRRGSRDATRDTIDAHLLAHHREVDVANARAAVEIAAARTRRESERELLIDILRDEDPDRQAERLIAAARRVRGE